MDSPRPIIKVRLIEVITSGKFATVHKAKRIPDTNEIIIVKSVRLEVEKGERDKQTELLRKNFELFVQLNHVNLVRHIHHQEPPVRDLAQVPIYEIIMEYCEGPTLRGMIKTFDMIPAVILQKWTKEILAGVGYLHEQRLVHRDIKGENILMTSNDINSCQIKIADLGDVKQLLGEATKTRGVSHDKGTWAFMSPEMINPDAKPEEKIPVGRKTDVWSLGCVVIEMINGAVPRFYKEGKDKMIRIKEEMAAMYFVGTGGSPAIPSGLPPVVEDFIKTCLTRDPEQRPTVADLKKHKFVNSAEEEVGLWILPPRDLLYDGYNV